MPSILKSFTEDNNPHVLSSHEPIKAIYPSRLHRSDILAQYNSYANKCSEISLPKICAAHKEEHNAVSTDKPD